MNAKPIFPPSPAMLGTVELLDGAAYGGVLREVERVAWGTTMTDETVAL